jgi:spermidine/putrescine transport system ATP-binding protein
VMNEGRIEQLGSPAELYESPRTTFVANFLGQSNLVRGQATGTDGDTQLVDVQGQRIALPARRNAAGTPSQGDDVLVGVRPEKIRLLSAGQQPHPGENSLVRGTVADASFTGVSTQYLVDMPWGQALTVFVQNLGTGGLVPVGTEVVLAWDPQHTFAVSGDASAGSQVEDALAGAS